MESEIINTTKVSTATDNSKDEEIVNPFLNEKFIPFLKTIGFKVEVIRNDRYEVYLANERFGLSIKNNEFKLVEFSQIIEHSIIVVIPKLLLPNSIDQFKMILACAEVFRLPANYRTDEQKLKSVEQLVLAKIEVCNSLLHGADNSETFNIVNASLTHLKKVSEEISYQSKF